jgi:hypothetical protein
MKALVTGASSGIGRDIAIYLSELGYDIILVSRDENRLKETAKKLKTKYEIITFDLSNKENCFKLYDKVKDQDIDILINNAGFGLFGNTWETSIEKEMKMIDLNISALHILTKLFLKDMVKKDKGYILNVSSSAGFFTGPYLNTYYATKNFVNRFTMGIYEELRHINSKVVVSCLCPGPVDTNFNKVAGGEFSFKPLSSEYVAKYAIDRMFKKKLVSIPGTGIKLGIFFRRFVPEKLLMRIMYKVQKGKEVK